MHCQDLVKDRYYCGVAVERVISTTGKREYASITTSKYSPFGSGPKKSMLRRCHGPSGNFVIFSGSGGFSLPIA